ncbi:MAG TPA: hypothetical protein VGR73_18195 [Bryobacteraceae bacterium]|nr:hypothetical protein [Bryobacteraceae bacterium]
MKSMLNSLQKLALGSLLAICLNAGFANAQTMAGKFTLPFAAHWGQANLPAGDYSFRLEEGPGGKVQVIRGNKAIAFVVDRGYSTDTSAGMSMTVVRNRAGYSVCDLNLPAIGKVLHYAPAKPRRNSAASEREIAQLTIPVTGIRN